MALPDPATLQMGSLRPRDMDDPKVVQRVWGVGGAGGARSKPNCKNEACVPLAPHPCTSWDLFPSKHP